MLIRGRSCRHTIERTPGPGPCGTRCGTRCSCRTAWGEVKRGSTTRTAAYTCRDHHFAHTAVAAHDSEAQGGAQAAVVRGGGRFPARARARRTEAPRAPPRARGAPCECVVWGSAREEQIACVMHASTMAHFGGLHFLARSCRRWTDGDVTRPVLLTSTRTRHARARIKHNNRPALNWSEGRGGK